MKPAATQPSRLTQLMQLGRFGIADVLACLLVGALCGPQVASFLLADAGTARHLRLGADIWRKGALPYLDTYTQLGAGRPWLDGSWLSDVLWAQSLAWGGLHAVCMLTVLAELIFVAVLWRLLARRCQNVCVCLLLCGAVVGLSLVHLIARPHIWAWSLCLWVFDVVDTRLDSQRARSIEVLLLLVVWANVHPSFVSGVALVTMTLVLQSIAKRAPLRSRAISDKKQAAWLSLGAMATTLCTPYGAAWPMQLWQFLSRSQLLARIDAYHGLNMHSALGCIYVAVMLLGLYALGRVPQPAWRIATFGLAAYVGLLAQRNVPFGAALMAVCMAESLDTLWTLWRAHAPRFGLSYVLRFAGSFTQNASDRAVHVWAICLLASLGAAASQSGQSALYQMPRVQQMMPLARTLAEHNVTGGVLCGVQWGTILGYVSEGHIRPLLDDRLELATDNELFVLQRALSGRHNWQAYMVQSKINWVLTEQDTALHELLVESATWHLAQMHEGLALWHRDRIFSM